MLKKCWLIQLFLKESKATIFPLRFVAFPFILTEALAECLLIQLSSSYYFLWGWNLNLKFSKLAIRKNKYSQTCHSRKTKYGGFANKELWFIFTPRPSPVYCIASHLLSCRPFLPTPSYYGLESRRVDHFLQ